MSVTKQKNDLANISSDAELLKVKRLLKKGALSQIAQLMTDEGITIEDLEEFLEMPDATPGEQVRQHMRVANGLEKREAGLKKAHEVRRTKKNKRSPIVRPVPETTNEEV